MSTEARALTAPAEITTPVVLKLLYDQREANEKLVLAAIRAYDLADQAEAAQASAEAAAAELERTERELRATAEVRERLLAIVGHDLRSPLGVISNSAFLLTHHNNLDARDAKLVAGVIRSGERMARMISQLLDFTRVRLGGGMTLDRKRVSLPEIFQPLAEGVTLHSGAQVDCQYEGDVTGQWDEDRLSEVFSNLLGNAADYAAPGTTIQVRGRDEGADVAVEVSNQGPPIPLDLLPQIFSPFRRARQVEWSPSGNLGLGLYIAQQMVLAHGGAIEAQSTAGTTTFRLRLPRQGPS